MNMHATTRAKGYFVIGLIALGLILSLFMGIEKASANHSWGGYHWARSTNPLKLSLGDNVSAAWDASLAAASADWSKSVVLDATVVPTKTSNPRTCSPVLGRVEVCNYQYGGTGWLGIATVWASGGHITQATVKLNDTYYRSAPYNTAAWRQFVVCQEIGHTFGLAHQDENFNNANLGTCMDYTNSPAANQHPNAHDYAQLESIYAHLDSANTSVAQKATAPAASIDPTDARTLARALRVPRAERESVFQTQESGQEVFTFVVWADGSDHADEDHH